MARRSSQSRAVNGALGTTLCGLFFFCKFKEELLYLFPTERGEVFSVFGRIYVGTDVVPPKNDSYKFDRFVRHIKERYE